MRTLELPTFDLSEQIARVRKDKGWDDARCQKAEQEYRTFLALCKKYQGVGLVPTQDGDDVWHAHVLSTRKYIEDCFYFLGHYLHHTPGVQLSEMPQASKDIYALHFGGASADCGDGGNGHSAPCSTTDDSGSSSDDNTTGFSPHSKISIVNLRSHERPPIPNFFTL